jgi:hypothetical protein
LGIAAKFCDQLWKVAKDARVDDVETIGLNREIVCRCQEYSKRICLNRSSGEAG